MATVQANNLGTFPNAQCTKYHNVICTTQKEHKHTNKHSQLDRNWYLHENKYKEPINNIKMCWLMDDIKLDLLI